MLDKDTLYRLYVTEQKTGKEIAAIAGVKAEQTIYNWLDKFGIARRDVRAAQRAIVPDRETLYRLYILEEMGIRNIAKVTGSSDTSISRLLKEYGIERRSSWEKVAGWNKGKPLPKDQRRRLSEIAKQRTGVNSSRYGAELSPETRDKIANSLKGRFRGEENPQWKGGSTYERQKWHSRFEYKEWRSAVYARDNYTCQLCGHPSIGNIQAHHIYPWGQFPEKRFDVDNGVTLCEPCHDSIKGKEMQYVEHFQSLILQSSR